MLKDAKFGDMFLTRNGLKAIFLYKKRDTNSVIIDGYTKQHHYDDEGNWYGLEEECDLDIVSIWK